LYDEEKNLYSHSLAGASELADQEHVATELTNPNGSDQLSNAAARNSFDEISRMKKVLESSKTQTERSEEKLTTNQITDSINIYSN